MLRVDQISGCRDDALDLLARHDFHTRDFLSRQELHYGRLERIEVFHAFFGVTRRAVATIHDRIPDFVDQLKFLFELLRQASLVVVRPQLLHNLIEGMVVRDSVRVDVAL